MLNGLLSWLRQCFLAIQVMVFLRSQFRLPIDRSASPIQLQLSHCACLTCSMAGFGSLMSPLSSATRWSPSASSSQATMHLDSSICSVRQMRVGGSIATTSMQSALNHLAAIPSWTPLTASLQLLSQVSEALILLPARLRRCVVSDSMIFRYLHTGHYSLSNCEIATDSFVHLNLLWYGSNNSKRQFVV